MNTGRNEGRERLESQKLKSLGEGKESASAHNIPWHGVGFSPPEISGHPPLTVRKGDRLTLKRTNGLLRQKSRAVRQLLCLELPFAIHNSCIKEQIRSMGSVTAVGVHHVQGVENHPTLIENIDVKKRVYDKLLRLWSSM